MTLVRQLILAVIILFILVYAGNVVVSLVNTRTLVDEQMQVHAQDTATSLGISMTQATRDNDIAALDTLFNAVSDSGFFQRIYFNNLEHKTLIDRTFPVVIEGVPDWFVNLVDLSVREGRAEVTSGWQRLGEVVVLSHPGKAYAKLWQVMLQQLGWFASVTLVACLLAYVALKWLLAPLIRVERQADAICKQDFTVQSRLPRPRELRRVVEAMNRMSTRLEEVFNNQLDMIRRLQSVAYRDQVTGLSNRTDFDAVIKTLANDPDGTHPGVLFLVALTDIGEINKLSGREAGNDILRNLGACITESLNKYPQALVARRQGLEFAILIADIDEHESMDAARQLFAHCCHFLQGEPSLAGNQIYMGHTYSTAIEQPAAILEKADIALDRAREYPTSYRYGLEGAGTQGAERSKTEWRHILAQCLDNRSLSLLSQVVVNTQDEAPVGVEIFSRIIDNGCPLLPHTTLPFLERFGLAGDYDMAVVELVNELVKSHSGFIVINLSQATLLTQESTGPLVSYLSNHRHYAERLIFEIKETVVHRYEESVKQFYALINPLGAQCAIDGFGHQASAFAYLGSLPLAYLKVHRSFIAGIDLSSDHQLYVKSLLQLAHSRDIPLVAEGVETAAELQCLKHLGVDFVQGYYLGMPEQVQ